MRARCALLLLALAALAGRVAAQTDPRLVGAVRLAQEGLSDSARATVARLASRIEPTDSMYPQVLYTRALIAADPRDMRTDLQRVAVEYASSNWADDALLRLALLEYAGGQLDVAARNLEQIALDHSASPLYARAAYWAGRIYFELRRPADACRWLRAGRAKVGPDADLDAQLAASASRCSNVADASPAPAAPVAAAPAPAAAATPGRADTTLAAVTPSSQAPDSASRPSPAAPSPMPRAPLFRIQIAAVNSQAAADSIAERARKAGADTVVVVREAPYYKVRVGAYSTRAAAAAALPDARKRFHGSPFVAVDRE
ncbi:MAG TPA: SPOR domain-containing protein [Gemmatimonadales bacterium]|nr:SPOR domain-containing protein [Gemmatimonadales bacterium]